MKKIFLLAILLLANASMLFATDPGPMPCGGGDPDSTPTNCPIDTWVVIFAAIALIITTIHLHKRQSKEVKIIQ